MAKRGLFGSRNTSLDSITNPDLLRASVSPEQQKKAGLGTRLLGEGWEAKVAALGSMMAGDPNAVSQYHVGQQAQAQAQREAAAKRADDLRKRSLDRQDWQWKQEYERDNPAPVIRDNNMGDVVRIDPRSGNAETIYEDPYAPTVLGDDGIRRPMQMMPRRPVGRLTPISDQQEPQMTVTPRELDALVQRYGANEVQRRLNSGIVAVRSN